MNNSVRVSVIMPVYNDYKFLESAINSILTQSFKDYELIICNDGSSNKECLNILAKYRSNEKVIILDNENNLGLPKSLNRCIDVASGKYIARMDGDDISLVDRLETEVCFLDENHDIDAVSSFASIIDEFDVCNGSIKYPLCPTFKQVLEGSKFVHPASMFRKEALLDVGCYRTDLLSTKGRCEDYDLWCRLYEKKHNCCNIDSVLIFYREEQNSYRKRSKISYKYNYLVKLEWRKKFKHLKPSFKSIFIAFLHWILPEKISFYFHKKKVEKKVKKSL